MLKYLLKYWFATYLITFPLFMPLVSAQNVPSELTDYIECDNNNEQCEELFQIALMSINKLPLDSTKAGLQIRLAEVRKDHGFWDNEAEGLFVSARENFKQLGNKCGESMALRAHSAFHIYNEDEDNAITLGQEALELAEFCESSLIQARTNSTLGVVFMMRGEYSTSLKFAIKAQELYVKADDQVGLAVCTQEMANIYGSMGDKKKAKEMMFEAAEIYKKNGEEMRYATCLTDICAGFLESQEPDSVLKYMPDVQAIFKKNNYRIGEAVAAYNLGDAYEQLNNCEKALNFYNQASELVVGTGFVRLEFEIELSRSACESALGNHLKAHEYVLKAKAMGDSSSSAEGQLNILKFLIKTAHNAGDHDLSYNAAFDYIELNDSLLNNERRQEVAILQEKYDAEKKQRQIEQLENQAENDRLKRNSLWLILGLILIASLIIINRERQRRKKSKELFTAQLELKEEKEQRLKEELQTKNRELSAKALHIAQKNEVLQSLRTELENIAEQQGTNEHVRDVVNTLKLDRVIDGNWEQFTQQFTELNPDFYKKVNAMSPNLSKSDLRLAALLRMNLNSKEIASLLNISNDGVKKARQRFRKKLDMKTEDSLETFISSI